MLIAFNLAVGGEGKNGQVRKIEQQQKSLPFLTSAL